MAKYGCIICTYSYDEGAESKKWEELSDEWSCPGCSLPKDMFVKVN